MTIVHEKPADDYDTFIQDGSILSKVRFIWRWQVMIIGTERKFPHQVMTSIVFNSVPIETTEDNWGTNPVLDRIKTVIRELKRWGKRYAAHRSLQQKGRQGWPSLVYFRYGVVDVFEPEDLMELRNIPKV